MELAGVLGVGGGEIVALVGAGGKTTTMYRLAAELAAAGRRVLLATTTRIYPPSAEQAHLVLGNNPRQLRLAFEQGYRVVASAPRLAQVRGETKLDPIDPRAARPLLARSGADVLLVEADGSAHRPLKAPNEHEPVYPDGTTLVIGVLGLSALGRPLDETVAFRLPDVLRASGAEAGSPVSAATVAALGTAASGILRGAPAVPRVLLLNQADTVTAAAREAVEQAALLAPGVPEFIVSAASGSVVNPPTVRRGLAAPRVAGVVLAAGGSVRMGTPKQLLRWNGETLVHRAARLALAAGLHPVVVVTGAHRGEVEAALADLPLLLVHNPEHAAGQSTSLRAGLQAVPPGAAAALWMLCDQPRLEASDVRLIVRTWQRGAAPAVVPLYDEQRGTPVLFTRMLFPELMAITGDRGGRSVIEAHAGAIEFVTMPDPAAGQDVDTPDAWAALTGQEQLLA